MKTTQPTRRFSGCGVVLGGLMALLPMTAVAQTYACDLQYFSTDPSAPADANFIMSVQGDTISLALFSDIVEDLKFRCEFVEWVDGVECYTYYASGTPVQFNLFENEPIPGDPATFTALAMSFMDTYQGTEFSRADFETRRFAVQMYRILSCR